MLALSALVRLLSPITPLPAIHDPADRNVAPQAAGDCHRLRMPRVTLPGSERGDSRGATDTARGRGGALCGDDFGGMGGPPPPPPPGVYAQDLVSYSKKKDPELFAIRKIPNHRVICHLPLYDSQGLAESHLDDP